MNILIGRYKLLSHGVFNAEKVFQETSPYLKGELLYSSEGFLSVQIFFKEEILSGRDLLAYSGRYKVVSETVVEHHIEICSQSRRDRSIEKRDYQIEDGILTLSVLYADNTKFEAKWELVR